MADIRRTKKFRSLAQELHNQCTLLGMTLVLGEADEVLASRIGALAKQLGVTERTVIDRYVTPDSIHGLAAAVVKANDEYAEIAEATEPVTLTTVEAGRVTAALGMTLKLLTEDLQQSERRSEALGTATDLADAVVGIGVAIAAAGSDGPIRIEGGMLVYIRTVLGRAVRNLRDGTWLCACTERHVLGEPCRLQRTLIGDLKLVGGWVDGAEEPPAERR